MALQNKKRTIFLTGCTGLLGSYLLKIFLEERHNVYLLVRKKEGLSAIDRIKNILKFWGEKSFLKKIRFLKIIEGDIAEKNLGLGKKSLLSLLSEVEEVYHCAAITAINLPFELIRRVNIEGTRNILVLSQKLKKDGKLNKINHISTAFVCGNYKKIFSENDLDVGQKFSSSYDKSKFEAEVLVGEFRNEGLWVDIYRPPIIVGDSLSGKIPYFRNFYQLLHLCKLGIIENLPLKDVFTYISPIDTVSRSIYFISQNTYTRNHNYHPFSMKPIYFEEIIKLASKIMKFKIPNFVNYDIGFSNFLTPVQCQIINNLLFFINFKARFSCNETYRILEKNTLNESLEFDAEFTIKLINYYVKREKNASIIFN